MLRSCYEAKMQFFKDDPSTKKVVWYFVPKDRPCLPFATVFASRIYDRKEEPQLPIGELYAPVPWRGGQAPGPVAICGNCGDAAKWLEGVSIHDPLPEVFPGTNVPKCCCPPSPQFVGEGASGGIFGQALTGEQASGGDVLEPFAGEQASGGEFYASYGFAGEQASGGEFLEPFAGEQASGGEFAVNEVYAGGEGSGGDFAVGFTVDGGEASGGDFTAVDNTVTVSCWAYPVRKQLNFAAFPVAGTCTCFSGITAVFNWNPTLSRWQASIVACGGTTTFFANCAGGAWHLDLDPGGRCGAGLGSLPSNSGGPGSLVLSGFIGLNTCCSGGISYTLSEPP